MGRLSAWLLVFCFGSAQALEFRWEPGDVLVLSGEPASTDLERLRRGKTPQRIVLHKVAEGHFDTALELGREWRQLGIPVEVRGYCLGLCADFMFLPARQRLVAADSILGFSSLSSVIEAVVQHGEAVLATRAEASAVAERLPSLRKDLAKVLEAEREVAESAGLPDRFHPFLRRLTGPASVTITPKARGPGLEIAIEPGLCELWMPSAAHWTAWGVDIRFEGSPDAALRRLKLETARIYRGAPVEGDALDALCPSGKPAGRH